MPFIRTSAGTWQFQSPTDVAAAGNNDASAVDVPLRSPTPSCQAVRRAFSALYRIEDFTLQLIGSGFFAQIYKVMYWYSSLFLAVSHKWLIGYFVELFFCLIFFLVIAVCYLWQLTTRQWFHLDLWNAGRKSCWLVSPACLSGDQKCPKSCFGTCRLWQSVTHLLPTCGYCYHILFCISWANAAVSRVL